MICPDADCRSAKKKAKSVRVMNVPAMSFEERARRERNRRREGVLVGCKRMQGGTEVKSSRRTNRMIIIVFVATRRPLRAENGQNKGMLFDAHVLASIAVIHSGLYRGTHGALGQTYLYEKYISAALTSAPLSRQKMGEWYSLADPGSQTCKYQGG